MASAPASSTCSVSSTAWRVSFDPAPAITVPRSPTSDTASATRATCSSSVRVAASPVVPPTTIPCEPWSSRCRHRRTAASSSTRPSGAKGVTDAVRMAPRSAMALRLLQIAQDLGRARSPVLTAPLARQRVSGGQLGRSARIVVVPLVLGRARRRRRSGPGCGLGRRSRLGRLRGLAGRCGLRRRSGLPGGRRRDRRLGLSRLDRAAMLVVLNGGGIALLLLAGRLLVEVLLDLVQLLLRLVGELLGLVKEAHRSLLSRVAY